MSTVTWIVFGVYVLSSGLWYWIGYSNAREVYRQGFFYSREDILRFAKEIKDEEEAER